MPGPMSVPNGDKAVRKMTWDERVKQQGRLRTGKTDLKRGKIKRKKNEDEIKAFRIIRDEDRKREAEELSRSGG